MSLYDKLFRNAAGHTVIWEKPNNLLRVASVLASISVPAKKGTGRELTLLSKISLIIWGYKEMTSGRSLFRKILGAVTLMTAVFGVARYAVSRQ